VRLDECATRLGRWTGADAQRLEHDVVSRDVARTGANFAVIVATNIGGEKAELACDAAAGAMIDKWLRN
jgi:hypothetical protein